MFSSHGSGRDFFTQQEIHEVLEQQEGTERLGLEEMDLEQSENMYVAF